MGYFTLLELCCFTALAVFIFLISKMLRKDNRIKKHLEKFNGPRLLPIIGNAWEFCRASDGTWNVSAMIIFGIFSKDLYPFSKIVSEEYGPCYRVWLFNLPFLVVEDPYISERVLSSTAHIDKSSEYKALESWLGQGLLTSSGGKWTKMRKMLTPTFHFKILDRFIDIMNDQSEIFVSVINNEIKKTSTLNIFPYAARCTLDIICETAMGKRVKAQTDFKSPYVKAVNRMTELAMFRMINVWLRPNWIWKLSPYGWEEKKTLSLVHNFTETVIKEKKAELLDKQRKSSPQDSALEEIGSKEKLAFLDCLLRAAMDANSKYTLTDEEIRNEVDTFMFEGHDTTATAVSFALFLLAGNPKCQEKVRQELTEIFGDNKTRRVTHEDLSKMKYLECCIKESLRMYPSVPLLGRHLKEDCALPAMGKIIPKGVTVCIATEGLHKNKEYFTDPLEFNPERFLPNQSLPLKINPYAYVPFSAGPRNCIGQKFAMMEEKILLAHFFRHFHLQPVCSPDDLRMAYDIIFRSLDGVPIKIQKLQNP